MRTKKLLAVFTTALMMSICFATTIYANETDDIDGDGIEDGSDIDPFRDLRISIHIISLHITAALDPNSILEIQFTVTTDAETLTLPVDPMTVVVGENSSVNLTFEMDLSDQGIPGQYANIVSITVIDQDTKLTETKPLDSDGLPTMDIVQITSNGSFSNSQFDIRTDCHTYHLAGPDGLILFTIEDTSSGSALSLAACRDIFPNSLGPGQTFTVSVTLLAHEDITAPALDEDVPSGWTVTPVDYAGFIYKPSTTEWLYPGAWNAGDSATIVYEVTIPSSTPFGQYEISGVVSAYLVNPFPVGCATTVDVVEDWNPWDNDAVITITEIQEIINHWITSIPKNGHVVTTHDIQAMIFLWLNS